MVGVAGTEKDVAEGRSSGEDGAATGEDGAATGDTMSTVLGQAKVGRRWERLLETHPVQMIEVETGRFVVTERIPGTTSCSSQKSRQQPSPLPVKPLLPLLLVKRHC